MEHTFHDVAPMNKTTSRSKYFKSYKKAQIRKFNRIIFSDKIG